MYIHLYISDLLLYISIAPEVREPKNVPELRVMMFRVDSQNPAKTPHVMLNLWSITHTSQGVIMSTEAANSWDVVGAPDEDSL